MIEKKLCNRENMLALLEKMENEIKECRQEWHRPSEDYLQGAEKQIEYIRHVLKYWYE